MYQINLSISQKKSYRMDRFRFSFSRINREHTRKCFTSILHCLAIPNKPHLTITYTHWLEKLSNHAALRSHANPVDQGVLSYLGVLAFVSVYLHPWIQRIVKILFDFLYNGVTIKNHCNNSLYFCLLGLLYTQY